MSAALRWRSVPYEWRDVNQKLHSDWVNQVLNRKGAPEGQISLPILTKGEETWYNIGNPSSKYLEIASKVKDA